MIHEQQVRQLCAVHAVNNLLQMSSTVDYDSLLPSTTAEEENPYSQHPSCQQQECDQNRTHESIVISHTWTCHEKILCRYYCDHSSFCRNNRFGCKNNALVRNSENDDDTSMTQNRLKRYWRIATRQEFDDIAYEVTQREKKLFTSIADESPTEDPPCTQVVRHKSLWDRISSQHGTPYFGNYSMEVLRKALQRRGVELEFYRVPRDVETIQTQNIADENGDVKAPKLLIGFILHVSEENQNIVSSSFFRIGRYLPIIKYFCNVGKHWYAITGVQYERNEYCNNALDLKLMKSHKHSQRGDTTNRFSWCLIDSNLHNTLTFHNDKELLDYLTNAQQLTGCLIFGAYFTL